MAGKKEKAEKTKLILDTIYEKTDEWDKEVFTVEDKQTDKAKELSKHLSEMTFANEDKTRWAKIVSTITGESVKIEKDEDLEFRALTAIVCITADKHGYETNKVLLALGDGTAVDHTGKVLGFIKPSRKIVRPATDAEMKEITDAQLKGLMEAVNIVFA